MLSIEASDAVTGKKETLYFWDKHLRAAQVKRIWNAADNVLEILLIFQDTGLPGDPMLTKVNDGIFHGVEIRTRPELTEEQEEEIAASETHRHHKSLADLAGVGAGGIGGLEELLRKK